MHRSVSSRAPCCSKKLKPPANPFSAVSALVLQSWHPSHENAIMMDLRRCLLLMACLAGGLLASEPSPAQDLSRDCHAWLSDQEQPAVETLSSILFAPCYPAARQAIAHAAKKLDDRQAALDRPRDPNGLIHWTDVPEFGEMDQTQLSQTQRYLAQLRALVELKASLEERRLADALALLAEIQNARSSLHPDDRDIWDEHRLDRISAVLNGQYQRTIMHPLRIDPPFSEWVLADPRRLFIHLDEAYLHTAPQMTDALMAMARNDEAMGQFLLEHWVGAADGLQVPFGLRVLAERLYGPIRANAEFEAALSAIRIDSGPDGLVAQMPLFNSWLPLPVATMAKRHDDTDDSQQEDKDQNPNDSAPEFNPFTTHDLSKRRHDFSIAELQQALRSSWAESDHY